MNARRRVLLAAASVVAVAVSWLLLVQPYSDPDAPRQAEFKKTDISNLGPNSASPKTREQKLNSAEIRAVSPLDISVPAIQKEADFQKQLAKSVISFETSLKDLELKRVKVFPPDPKHHGNVVNILISAPTLEEVAIIANLMKTELDSAPKEMGTKIRSELQKKYDDYVNFRKPYRFVDAIRADSWAQIKVSIAYTESVDSENPESLILENVDSFFMDPKKPASENRYSHLFGIEEVPE